MLTANTNCALGLEWTTPVVHTYPTDWVNGGTAQSLICSTGTAITWPTGTALVDNRVCYRQLGPKTWEVAYKVYKTSGGGNGSGEYIWNLPNGLCFDTTSDFQNVSTIGEANSSLWLSLMMPASVSARRGDWGTAGSYVSSSGGVVPYCESAFRVVAHTLCGYSNQYAASTASVYQGLNVINSSFFGVGSEPDVSWTVQFTFQST